ncbi:hypothetical protein METHB2_50086 [Candidatus Methylobacter favarea]|uniref:Uncharacterized protein n=1 Tax=Candidatus Methylobacter favarea TaxID=2707345 RepID=A0A8S0YAG1_9GAMM|nr:hypothetical protein [Candidatus Methylobacter favarea]CAA9891815.1 hypothetical protein METHB2_50086 [Candidatus Methylobacter favarea]
MNRFKKSEEIPDYRTYHRILYQAEAALGSKEKIWPCKIFDRLLKGCVLCCASSWG